MANYFSVRAIKPAMKIFMVSAVFIFAGNATLAQLKRPAPHKRIDSLKLSCPIAGGVLKLPDTVGIGYKGDLKVLIKSGNADSLFLAPTDGKIDLITRADDGKNEMVMHYANYNIWFIGITKALVKKNDTIKKGQPIGTIMPGDEIELLLFDDEEPVDPKKYLDCKMK